MEEKIITCAVIGFGARGQLYSELLLDTQKVKIVAVCDVDSKRLDDAKKFGVPADKRFNNEKEFFNQGKIADILIVSTLDQHHYKHTIQAIDKGYNILLEKPIATTEEDCIDMCRRAKEKNVNIFVCYVLRYAPFFNKIKELLDTGDLGEIATINLTENVAYWHQAHSFVRGNWRNTVETSPMIVAKSCHDMDILCWLMDRKAESVSSYGDLTLFKKENAPEGCAHYCFECKYNKECPYECSHFYKKYPWWLKQVGIYRGDFEDKQAIEKCLTDKNNPYSRCVYYCDNNAVDHQVVNIQFEGGATAHFTMTAFSNDTYRELHIHCTFGEIYGNMVENKIYYNIFGKKHGVIDLNDSEGIEGHGGGDKFMIETLVASMLGDEKDKLKNVIFEALQSHIIGFAAERSRVNQGKPVNVKELLEQ